MSCSVSLLTLHAEDLVAHQRAVLEVHVQDLPSSTLWMMPSVGVPCGLREVQRDQPAALDADAGEGVEAVVAALEAQHCGPTMVQSSNTHVRPRRAWPGSRRARRPPAVSPHQSSAHRWQRRKVIGSSGRDRHAGHAAAEGAADADAVLDQHAERLDLVGAVEEEPAVAAGDIEVAAGPAVPADGGEGLLGVRRRPALGVGPDRSPTSRSS